MKAGKKYPFDSLVYCNIGNPQVGCFTALLWKAIESETTDFCSSGAGAYFLPRAGEDRS